MVSVVNNGGSTAKNVYGKITIDHTTQDVVDYGPIPSLITTKFYEVKDMSLCWAFSGNPATKDVAIGGIPEMLIVSRVENVRTLEKGNLTIFNFPSEEGFGKMQRGFRATDGENYGNVTTKSRILLVAKDYDGVLKVGGDDISPVKTKFKLVYDEQKGIANIVLLA